MRRFTSSLKLDRWRVPDHCACWHCSLWNILFNSYMIIAHWTGIKCWDFIHLINRFYCVSLSFVECAFWALGNPSLSVITARIFWLLLQLLRSSNKDWLLSVELKKRNFKKFNFFTLDTFHLKLTNFVLEFKKKKVSLRVTNYLVRFA